MIRMGVIGYGYWGPNIVRNFNSLEGSKVVAVCDLSEAWPKRPGRPIRICGLPRSMMS